MAAADFSPTYQDHNVRPYHLKVLHDILNGSDDDTYTVVNVVSSKASETTNCNNDIDSQETTIDNNIVTVKASIDTLVDASDATDKAGLKSSIHSAIDAVIGGPSYLNTLKATIASHIAAIPEDNPISDALTAAQTIFEAAIAADTTTFPAVDAWCTGRGQYEKGKDPEFGDPANTDLKHCDVCDGFGRGPAKEIVIVKPSDTTYPA